MGRVFMELILPTQRRVPSYNLVIFSQAKGDSILICITHLMKLLNAELVITSPIDQFQADLVIEEGSDDIKIVDNSTSVDMRVLHLKRSAAILHM